MDLDLRLRELARIQGAPTPVVSVYLNTHWSDERQRERVRLFLKNEIRKARARAEDSPGLDSDLDWVQAEAQALIEQARSPEARGVALFACQGLGLREVLPVRVRFDNTFVIADAPLLRPLAAALEKTPAALVVFVDTESARLIPLMAEGAGEAVSLQSDVPGHHRQGGWALLAQSRYQRHIQEHRGRHFEAVACALVNLAKRGDVRQIVMAGELRNVVLFEKHLPGGIAERIAGRITGARHESAGILLDRAARFLGRLDGEETAAVDAVLTEAAKSGGAVAGLEETLEAVSRGAVRRLYMLKGFNQPGRACPECGSLKSGASRTCRLCGTTTKAAELGEVIVDRVIGTGGSVNMIEPHPGLESVGGVAALLRYPL